MSPKSSRLLVVVSMALLLFVPGDPLTGAAAGARALLAGIVLTHDSGFVLQSDGQLVAFDQTTGAIGKRRYLVPPAYLALDAVGWNQGSRWMVCLPVFQRSRGARQSWLLQYSPAGEEWTWLPSKGAYVGVGIDDAHAIAYVANAATGEVFSLPLGQKKAAATYVGSVPNASQLGSAAYDPGAQDVIISDADYPNLYAVNVASGKSRLLASIKGAELRSIAIDPARRTVFVADAGQEVVWAVTLRPSVTVRRFSSLPEFDDPTAIAVSPTGRVWLADAGASTVFRLTDQGTADLTIKW